MENRLDLGRQLAAVSIASRGVGNAVISTSSSSKVKNSDEDSDDYPHPRDDASFQISRSIAG
jgi:DNA-binding FrmR family transcriptional regulator